MSFEQLLPYPQALADRYVRDGGPGVRAVLGAHGYLQLPGHDTLFAAPHVPRSGVRVASDGTLYPFDGAELDALVGGPGARRSEWVHLLSSLLPASIPEPLFWLVCQVRVEVGLGEALRLSDKVGGFGSPVYDGLNRLGLLLLWDAVVDLPDPRAERLCELGSELAVTALR